jgi:hypothetical protein
MHVGIELSPEHVAEMDEIRQRFGLTKASVLKLAWFQFVEHVRRAVN